MYDGRLTRGKKSYVDLSREILRLTKCGEGTNVEGDGNVISGLRLRYQTF